MGSKVQALRKRAARRPTPRVRPLGRKVLFDHAEHLVSLPAHPVRGWGEVSGSHVRLSTRRLPRWAPMERSGRRAGPCCRGGPGARCTCALYLNAPRDGRGRSASTLPITLPAELQTQPKNPTRTNEARWDRAGGMARKTRYLGHFPPGPPRPRRGLSIQRSRVQVPSSPPTIPSASAARVPRSRADCARSCAREWA